MKKSNTVEFTVPMRYYDFSSMIYFQIKWGAYSRRLSYSHHVLLHAEFGLNDHREDTTHFN